MMNQSTIGGGSGGSGNVAMTANSPPMRQHPQNLHQNNSSLNPLSGAPMHHAGGNPRPHEFPQHHLPLGSAGGRGMFMFPQQQYQQQQRIGGGGGVGTTTTTPPPTSGNQMSHNHYSSLSSSHPSFDNQQQNNFVSATGVSGASSANQFFLGNPHDRNRNSLGGGIPMMTGGNSSSNSSGGGTGTGGEQTATTEEEQKRRSTNFISSSSSTSSSSSHPLLGMNFSSLQPSQQTNLSTITTGGGRGSTTATGGNPEHAGNSLSSSMMMNLRTGGVHTPQTASFSSLSGAANSLMGGNAAALPPPHTTSSGLQPQNSSFPLPSPSPPPHSSLQHRLSAAASVNAFHSLLPPPTAASTSAAAMGLRIPSDLAAVTHHLALPLMKKPRNVQLPTQDLSIPPSQTIYINNINDKVKLRELKENLKSMFKQFGEIRQIVAMSSFWRRGQAWIVFSSVDSATKAIQGMQGFIYHGQPLRINYSITKSDIVAKDEGTFVPRPPGPKKPRAIREREERQRELFLQMQQQYMQAQMQAAGTDVNGIISPGAAAVGAAATAATNGTPVETAAARASTATLAAPLSSLAPGTTRPPAPTFEPPSSLHRNTESSASGGGGEKSTSTLLQQQPSANTAPAIEMNFPALPNKVLFVENLPTDATQENLANLFNRYAGMVEVRPVLWRRVAFIEYENELLAASAMNGKEK